MKLDVDCVRDVLFYLEEHLEISPELELNEISVWDLECQLNYPIQELANTLLMLHEAGYIEAVIDFGSNRIILLDVYRITYDGHQFIESIRPESVWKRVKATGKQVGSFSIDVITQIATGTLSSIVNGYLTGQLIP